MKKHITVAVILAFCAAAAFLVVRRTAWREGSLEARIEGSYVALSPAVPGKVASIAVEEGSLVFPGQEIYRLESSNQEKALQEARNLQDVLAASLPPELLLDDSGDSAFIPLARQTEDKAYRTMQDLSEARGRADFALARTRVLYDRGEATREALALARDRVVAAEAVFARAKAEYESVSLARSTAEKTLGAGRPGSGAQSGRLALYRAQAEQVRMAEEMLEATVIRAPEPGVVTRITALVGEEAMGEARAVFIMPYTPDHIWVSAFFDPAMARNIKIGDPCLVRLGDFDGPELDGRIIDMLPPEKRAGQEGEMLPVRVGLTSYDPASMPVIRPGMEADVRLKHLPVAG